MNKITSIYIPHVQKRYNAKYIAKVFSKNCIAQVSQIYLKPYNNNIKRSKEFYQAYVEIQEWHETEAAYSFIRRLRNPNVEARIVHYSDNWWAVEINTDCSFQKLDNNQAVKIDVQKTELLKSLLASFKNKQQNSSSQPNAIQNVMNSELTDEYYKNYYNAYIAARERCDELDRLREIEENSKKHRISCYEDGLVKEVYIDDDDYNDYLMENYYKYIDELSRSLPCN